MKIDIHITDANPTQLMALAKFITVAKLMEVKKDKKDAPYGLRKDGTPRKKIGRPLKETL